jgi:peptidoglycan/xylan/chitin deacetylase (PgdA/CDA1 family)
MGATFEAGMVVEPDTLDLHLRYLRRYFEIVPLSYLASNLQSYGRNPQTKPLCALTFDDGWRDFYEYAYPILKTHEAPATVFLPTDFVGTERWFWTDRLGFLLDRIAGVKGGTKRELHFSDVLLRQIVSMSGTPETRLEKAIAALKPQRIDKIEDLIAELSAALGEEPNRPDRAFLTWEEVEEMYYSGLVCFGSHTAAHPFLTALTEEQAQQELCRSLDVLIARKVVNSDFLSFCYPYGSYSERLSEMVRHAGYHLATTGEYGWHRQGANPFTVKRIPIHQDISATNAMFASRLANVF